MTRGTTRVIAIDWSGAKAGARRKIWLAEANAGDLTRLECGRDREETIEWLISAATTDRVVVGFDFAFSFPGWFLDQQGFETARHCWGALAEGCGEEWLRACDKPFWGRPGRSRPTQAESPFRRTEAGISAKSVFQIGGAGAVGTGSLRGMPQLHALAAAGFLVWPFDAPAANRSVAIEIYPRLWSPGVKKSVLADREAFLARPQYPCLSPEMRRKAVTSEDSFDAAISALAMDQARPSLDSLPAVVDPALRREGIIWTEDWESRVTA
jgi:hypothetical protein